MTFIDNEIIRRNMLGLVPINNALHSETVKTMQAEQATVDYWKREINNFHLGCQIVVQAFEDNPKINQVCDEENIKIEDCLIKESDLAMLKDEPILEQLISGSITLQELWHKSASALLVYYTIGKDLFDQKKCLEAHHVFSFLTMMNQNIPCFWLGKGAANEALENWDKALSDYWMAQALTPNDASIYQALIRIYKKLKDKESLEECFQIIDSYPEIKKELIKEV